MARAEETGRVEGTGSVLRLQPEGKGKWEGNGRGLYKWCQSLCFRTPMEMEERRQLCNIIIYRSGKILHNFSTFFIVQSKPDRE